MFGVDSASLLPLATPAVLQTACNAALPPVDGRAAAFSCAVSHMPSCISPSYSPVRTAWRKHCGMACFRCILTVSNSGAVYDAQNYLSV